MRKCYILTVNGYFGDSDLNFHKEHIYGIHEESKLLKQCLAYSKFQKFVGHEWIEEYEQLKDYLLARDVDVENIELPNEWDDILPHITDMEITYYCGDGIPFYYEFED